MQPSLCPSYINPKLTHKYIWFKIGPFPFVIKVFDLYSIFVTKSEQYA